MDFFEELGKQTAKLMNNFTETVSELSSLATDSADSISNIVIYKTKLENTKSSLNKLYKQIGQKYVQDPDGNYNDLISQAQELEKEIENLQNEIETSKQSISQTGADLKDKALENSKDLLKNLKLDSKEVYDDTKSVIIEEKDKIDTQIDQNVKNFKTGFNEEFNK